MPKPVNANGGAAIALLTEHRRLRHVPLDERNVVEAAALVGEGVSLADMLSGMIVVANTLLDIMEWDYDANPEEVLQEIARAVAYVELGLGPMEH